MSIIKWHLPLICFHIYVNAVFACSFTNLEKTNFFTDKYKNIKRWGDDNSIEVYGCSKKKQGKYLTIGIGPDLINLKYERGWSYTGFFHDDYCKLQTPSWLNIEKRNYEQRLTKYQQKSNLLDSCFLMRVRSMNDLDLKIPNAQQNCKISKISNKIALLSGGFCFIETNQQTHLQINYHFSKTCLESKSDFLKATTDFNFISNFFTSSDPSGHSVDLKYLAHKEFMLYQIPNKNKVKLSTPMSFETPRWPAQGGPNLHFAALNIKEKFDETKLEVSLLADQVCSKVNSQNLNFCDFRYALGAELRIYQLDNKNNKSHLIHLDYVGVAIPSGWQGILPLTHSVLTNGLLQKGKAYRLELNFAYPDTYFRLARNKSMSFTIATLNKHNKTIGIDSLDELEGLPGLVPPESFPEVQTLPTIEQYYDKSEVSYQGPLHTLLSYLNVPGWPPYYLEICDYNNDLCKGIYDDNLIHNMAVEFTVDKSQILQKIDKLVKNSNISKSYELVAPELPIIVCQ